MGKLPEAACPLLVAPAENVTGVPAVAEVGLTGLAPRSGSPAHVIAPYDAPLTPVPFAACTHQLYVRPGVVGYVTDVPVTESGFGKHPGDDGLPWNPGAQVLSLELVRK